MKEFEVFFNKQLINERLTPHANNLKHKLIKANENGELDSKLIAFKKIIYCYEKVLDHSFAIDQPMEEWARQQLHLLNNYLNLLSEPSLNLFSHQSDFKSSIIPEFVCIIFEQIIRRKNLNLKSNGQNDIVIDLIFSHINGGQVFPKHKRVDAALLAPFSLSCNENKEIENKFCIPLIAVEVKTNLDKNMLSGIIHSVERLKSTFPECKYFVLTEFSDFDVKKQNFANSSIDEIYLLRKQKRSEVRSKKKVNDISFELVKEIIVQIEHAVSLLTNSQNSLSNKLSKGLLIGTRG